MPRKVRVSFWDSEISSIFNEKITLPDFRFYQKYQLLLAMTGRVYLTPFLYVSREEEAIIDALVDHHELPTSFDTDQVVSYFEGQDFCLVLYFSCSQDRGFQQYVVQDFCWHVEDLQQLSLSFGKMISMGYNHQLFGQAKHKIDHLICMCGTFRAMFNKAKDPD
ncbi:MAG: hypothetical protein ACK4GN_05010 [Runella sp.]